MIAEAQGLRDFSNCTPLANYYSGTGRKFPIDLDGARYMVKLAKSAQPEAGRPSTASTSNMPVCEYLGCHVFEAAGLPVQRTVLGTWHGEPAVACRDFVARAEQETPGKHYALAEFSSLESAVYSSSELGKAPAIEQVLEVIATCPGLEPVREAALERFWETFAVDAIIGNPNRQASNWGYMVDLGTGSVAGLAPVYSCGRSMCPEVSQESMREKLSGMAALREYVRNQPGPCLTVGGKSRPTYAEVLAGPYGKQAREALAWAADTLSLATMENVVKQTPGLSDLQRDFYTAVLKLRMEEVVRPGCLVPGA